MGKGLVALLLCVTVGLVLLVLLTANQNDFLNGKNEFLAGHHCEAVSFFLKAVNQPQGSKDPAIPFYTAANYAAILGKVQVGQPCPGHNWDAHALLDQIEYYYNMAWDWARQSSPDPVGEISKSFQDLALNASDDCQSLVGVLPKAQLLANVTTCGKFQGAIPPTASIQVPYVTSPPPTKPIQSPSGAPIGEPAPPSPVKETVIVTVPFTVTTESYLSGKVSLGWPLENKAISKNCQSLNFQWAYQGDVTFRIVFYHVTGTKIEPLDDVGTDTQGRNWMLNRNLESGDYKWQVLVLNQKMQPQLSASSDLGSFSCY